MPAATDSSHRGLQAGDPAHARRDPNPTRRYRTPSPSAPCPPPPRRRFRSSTRPADGGSGCQGLCGVPWSVLMPAPPYANCTVMVLPSSTIPARVRRSTTAQSEAGTLPAKEPRARGRRQARHVVQVLGHVGDAVQRAEVDARPELRVRGARLVERPVTADHGERPEARLERVDSIEEVLPRPRPPSARRRGCPVPARRWSDSERKIASHVLRGTAVGRCIVRRLADTARHSAETTTTPGSPIRARTAWRSPARAPPRAPRCSPPRGGAPRIRRARRPRCRRP